MSTWKLFYDGGCNLCHVSKLRAEKWAAKAGQPLSVDVLASDEAIQKGYGEAMVLEADGRVLTAADAWMKLMSIAPWYLRWLSWFRLSKPTMAAARSIYGLVAKYRYKWFGTRACQVPSSANRI
jgi:predicted DCC family thiol-disulfide oxidoreductase YuxK